MKQNLRFGLILDRPAVLKICGILQENPTFEGFFPCFHGLNKYKIRISVKMYILKFRLHICHPCTTNLNGLRTQRQYRLAQKS